MTNAVLHSYSVGEALPVAWRYYLKTCGLSEQPDSPRHARMLARSSTVLGDVLPKVSVRALTKRFPGACLSGETLALGGVSFECRAFGRLDPARVFAVYPYLLTAGDVYLETDNVSDQLFADIWGTSFADAGVELLKSELARENEGYTLSSSFGPGFYGMDIGMMERFFALFDASEIGVTLHSNCLLLPLKSCAGFFVALADEWMLPTRDCESCLGNPGGCRFCKNYVPPYKNGDF